MSRWSVCHSTTSKFMWRWAMPSLSISRTGSTAQIYGNEWGSIPGVWNLDIQIQRLRVGLELGTLDYSSPTRYGCAMIAISVCGASFESSLRSIVCCYCYELLLRRLPCPGIVPSWALEVRVRQVAIFRGRSRSACYNTVWTETNRHMLLFRGRPSSPCYNTVWTEANRCMLLFLCVFSVIHYVLYSELQILCFEQILFFF